MKGVLQWVQTDTAGENQEQQQINLFFEALRLLNIIQKEFNKYVCYIYLYLRYRKLMWKGLKYHQ